MFVPVLEEGAAIAFRPQGIENARICVSPRKRPAATPVGATAKQEFILFQNFRIMFKVVLPTKVFPVPGLP